MNAKKFFFILSGSLVVLVILAGSMLYGGNKLMKKSADSLVNAKLDNIGAEAQEKNYVQAKKDLEKYSDLSSLVTKILPKDKDQARAISEIYKIGSETRITIDKIQFPTSTLGQKTVTPSPAASSTTTTPTPAPSTSTVTQAKAVDGLKSVLGIDIEISSGKKMQYQDMLAFLQKIESNRRSMQVKKISVHPDFTTNTLSFDVTLTIFVKP